MVYYDRGRAKTIKSDFDEAITDFSKAIELKPDHVDTYYYQRNCLSAKRRF